MKPSSQSRRSRGRRCGRTCVSAACAATGSSTAVGSRKGIAAKTSPAVTTAVISDCASDPDCAMMKLPAPPPTKPPRLQNPWLEDMIARCRRRSISTACAFIATSMQPAMAPKAAMKIARTGIDGENTTAGSAGISASENTDSTRRPPKRAIRRPANSMEPTAPRPSTRISSPNVPSVIAWRGKSSGICGAHAPMTKPLAMNIAATAQRARAACLSCILRPSKCRPRHMPANDRAKGGLGHAGFQA